MKGTDSSSIKGKRFFLLSGEIASETQKVIIK